MGIHVSLTYNVGNILRPHNVIVGLTPACIKNAA